MKRRVPILSRYNIPAPVVGGLPVAAILALLYATGRQPLAFDTALQTPLQNTVLRLGRASAPACACCAAAGRWWR